MNPGASHVRVLALLLTAVAAGVLPAPARDQASSPARLLDVPYLPQTEALCGGAAAAMVMRYWGDRQVYPDAFAALVERDAGGIRTSALTTALEQRSWIAIAGPSDAGRIQRQLGIGRPVIALIEDSPGRFHYVIIVGWTRSKVIFHDPARAPFRIIDAASFDRAWQAAGRWALVALPPPTVVKDIRDREPAAPDSSGPCSELINEGLRRAQSNDRSGARTAFETAADSCRDDSAPWREIAGLDALEGNWRAAESDAGRAIARNPSDQHAWRILGTAAYVQHEDLTALDAWNHVNEPTVDLVDLKGLERTRYAVVARAVNLAPGKLLTSERLLVAERRARDVPAISTARVTFHPIERGRAQIDAAVVERSAAPSNVTAWSAIGLRAATDREVAPSFASVTGGGELITASWRWWEHRPRVAFSLAAPAPPVLGSGVWRVHAARETETFGLIPFKETRTSVGIAVSNWLTSRTRAEAGVAVDKWNGRSPMTALTGAIEVWPSRERLAVDARGAVWVGPSPSFSTAGIRARWRSSSRPIGSVVLMSAGLQIAALRTPALLWPGADTGPARDVLLRAHPLLDGGVISGGVFGRRLLYGSGEWRHWMRPLRVRVPIAPAAFVDTARAADGLPSTDRRTHVDVGSGLRISLVGYGVLRIDLARGLRDRHTTLTAGWER